MATVAGLALLCVALSPGRGHKLPDRETQELIRNWSVAEISAEQIAINLNMLNLRHGKELWKPRSVRRVLKMLR